MPRHCWRSWEPGTTSRYVTDWFDLMQWDEWEEIRQVSPCVPSHLIFKCFDLLMDIAWSHLVVIRLHSSLSNTSYSSIIRPFTDFYFWTVIMRLMCAELCSHSWMAALTPPELILKLRLILSTCRKICANFAVPDLCLLFFFFFLFYDLLPVSATSLLYFCPRIFCMWIGFELLSFPFHSTDL